ncbi:efflux transporter outer membrane subunit [Cupriavidus gilardii]|uniref:efflux transporter outer membrane subunit n=1 Tax=Cupriavidus gilardii TaxID=82541 RepID=UPI001ABE4933|nr:efflux transporter outer membrane subunit [Cupriavidus gilardii]MBO4119436.1 efflux transporter outer membrane subunit [Cupriavidus gilardii]
MTLPAFRCRRLAPLAGAAALLAGCAVGPDFVAPPAPDSARYGAAPLPSATTSAPTSASIRHGQAQHLVDGADVPAQWWSLFGSAALDSAIRTALANSPTLAEAQASLERARHDYAAAAGIAQWPAIDARLDAARQQVNIESMGITAFPSPAPFTLYGASVRVSYVLDLFGAQRRELEGLRAAVDFQRYELEAARLSLAANVATAAIREASLRAQIEDTEALIDAQRRQLAIVEQGVALGGTAGVEAQRQRGELAQTEALLPGLSRQLAATRHQLAIYLGLPPEAAAEPEQQSAAGQAASTAPATAVPVFRLSELRLPDTLPVSLPSTLARRRPDIRAAEALLHRASADIGMATANLYPSLTLSASAGTQSRTGGDLFDHLNVWNIAAGLVQPVFRGGALRARQRAAEAAYRQALAAHRQAVLQGLREVADALQAVHSDAATLRARAEAAQRAAATLAIVTEQYRLGGVSQLALIDAQRQHRETTLALTRASADRLADSAALLQALGGGWWQAEADAEADDTPRDRAGRQATTASR